MLLLTGVKEKLRADLAEFISTKGITLSQIGKTLGLSKQRVHQILFDKNFDPKVETLDKIANAIGFKYIIVYKTNNKGGNGGQ